MTSGDSKIRLADWFRQWRTPLRKFLSVKGSVRSADLDDVAQEVFLRLMRYERGDLVENPQAYLFKVASNVAAEWSIRARNARPHDSVWLADLLATDQPEENVAQSAVQQEVERALNTLAPRQREVLKLQFSEGLSHAEIAARLNTTRRSVKRILLKSYVKLREELDVELLGAITHGRE